MKITLVHGPAKSGKTRYVVDRFVKEIDKEPIVIVPSSESVRYIKRLALQHPSIKGFLGYRIITFDHLVNIFMAGYEGISKIGRYFLLRNIVNNLELKYFLPVKDYIGFYELLGNFISELKSGEITPEVFLNGIKKKGATEKDKEIHKIYSLYQEELHKLNVYDHEGKFWQVQRIINNGDIGPLVNSKFILVDGFQNFSPAELRIIESIGKFVEEIIITCESTLKAYKQIKKVFKKIEEIALPPKEHKLNNIEIISCPGQAREAEEIARRVKKLIVHAGKRPDDIAVLFRDLSTYKELIAEIFNKYGIPYYISEGIPLIKNPYIRRNLRRFESLKVSSLKEYISLMDKPETPEEFDAYNKLMETVNEPFAGGSYESLIYIAESAEYQRQLDSEGVQILDVHKARGLEFPVVFIGGLIEKEFPKQISEEPLYGDIERIKLRRFGVDVEESKEKQKEELFLFQSAVSTASEYLYLTYPATDSNGKEELRSYYIDEIRKACDVKEKRIPLSYVIPELEDICTYEDLAIRSAYDRKDYLGTDGFVPSRNGIITDNEILERIKNDFGPDYRFSVSQFNEYGTCPFSYFCKRVLGLEPIEELEDEILPIDEGNLYHWILREYYASGGDIEKISEKYFKVTEEKGRIKNNALWELKRTEVIDTLKHLIEYETNEPPPLGIKRTPAYFELSFGMEENSEPLVINDVMIRGKIDRIDLTESELFVVVDYKSGGKLISVNEILKGTNLQLPIYVMAAKDVLGIGIDALEAYFFYVKRRKYFHANPMIHFKPSRKGLVLNLLWEEYMDKTREYVREYANSIRAGRFSPSPKDECPSYCDYKNICRYH